MQTGINTVCLMAAAIVFGKILLRRIFYWER